MDRGAWWATVHSVAKSWIGLKRCSTVQTRSARGSEKGGKKCCLPRILSLCKKRGERGWSEGPLGQGLAIGLMCITRGSIPCPYKRPVHKDPLCESPWCLLRPTILLLSYSENVVLPAPELKLGRPRLRPLVRILLSGSPEGASTQSHWGKGAVLSKFSPVSHLLLLLENPSDTLSSGESSLSLKQGSFLPLFNLFLFLALLGLCCFA